MLFRGEKRKILIKILKIKKKKFFKGRLKELKLLFYRRVWWLKERYYIYRRSDFKLVNFFRNICED